MKLREETFSFIELLRSHIPGGRNSKAPVPYHQVLILLVRHFRILILACQVVIDILGDIISAPLGMLLVRVYAFDIFRELSLNLLVIHRGLGVICTGQVEIVITAVRTGNIGNIPDGIGTGSVKQRSARKRIGVAADVLGSIALDGILVLVRPLHAGLIPICRIQRISLAYGIIVLALLNPLFGNLFIMDGIGKTCTIDADCGFEFDPDFFSDLVSRNRNHLTVTLYDHRSIESICRNADFRINQLVCFPVRKLVAPLIHVIFPLDRRNSRLIHRSLERLCSHGLRHTGNGHYVCIRFLVINHKKIAVSHIAGTVAGLSFTVSIVRMAIQTSRTDSQRAEACEGAILVFIVIPLEKSFTILKLHSHTGLFNGRSRLLIRIGIDDTRGSEHASGIIFSRVFCSSARADIDDIVNVFFRVIAFAACGGEREHCQC